MTWLDANVDAVIAAHPQALMGIKWIGAAYLLFLAWKSWTAPPPEPAARASVRTWNIVRRGMLSNLLNPKPVLFLLAFLDYCPPETCRAVQ